MIVVKVSYTVKQEFVTQNEKNIREFLQAFRKLDTRYFRYQVYQSKDKRTFTHLSHFENEDIQQTLLNLPAFLAFQESRDASGLEREPQIEYLNPVDSSEPFLAGLG